MLRRNYILGDNPFFNVDHSGRENFKSNPHHRNAEVVSAAVKSGVEDFMLTPHADHTDLLAEIRNRGINKDLNLANETFEIFFGVS